MFLFVDVAPFWVFSFVFSLLLLCVCGVVVC